MFWATLGSAFAFLISFDVKVVFILFFLTAVDQAFAAPRPTFFYKETSSLVTCSNWPRHGLGGPFSPFFSCPTWASSVGLGVSFASPTVLKKWASTIYN